MDSGAFATVTIDVPPNNGTPTTSVEVHQPVKHLVDAERRALSFARRKLSSEYSNFRNRGTNTTVARYLVASGPLITVNVLKDGGMTMGTHGRLELPDFLDESDYDAAVDRILGSVSAAITDLR